MARLNDHTMQNDFLDLQSRLEHLITYSSQLVFVSGDGMGKQLNFAQHFLSQQNELANIGYVDANESTDVVTYRKKFIRQLVGPLKVDYSKPLTVLVPRLIKEQSQFILIAVTHAEYLPDEFMQELWDLVLQNRFAKNRHHLNILVFGEKHWASKAKSWLPANSHNKPVLLANESVDRSAQESKPNTELEQLIATKRQQFSERIAAREHKQISATNVLNQWWMKLLLSIVFFVTFTGILLTQYVSLDQAKAFYASIFEGNVPSQVEDEVVEQEVTISNVEPVAEITQPIGDQPTEAQTANEPVETKPSFLELADDQRRVVDWEDAVKSLPTEPLDISSNDTNELDSATEVAASTEELSLSDEGIVDSEFQDEALNQDAIETTDIEDITEDFDYPVEDITSVEQLDAIAATQTQEQEPVVQDGVTVNEAAESDNQSEVESIETADVAASDTSSVAETEVSDYFFNEATLLELPAEGYALQLSAMSTEEALASFLQTNQLTDNIWIYKTQRFGGDWFVVLHNQTFESLDAANDAIQGLGLSAPPFAKPVTSIQQEISLN